MNFKRYLNLLLAICVVGAARAQTPTFTQVYLHSPTLVSGTANPALRPALGSIYKYTNVGRTTTANTIDAYVQYVKTTNTGTNAVGLHTIDVPASVNSPGGYDSAFQPVTSCSRTNSSGLWTQSSCGTGFVDMTHSINQNYLTHFRIYFKKGGTQIDTALNLRVSFIDIDGFGGGTEAEQNAFMPGISYALAPSTTLTVTQRNDGLLNAEGQPANVGGISLTTITAITQVVYLNRTYIEFAAGMNTHDANASGGCYDATSGGRLASISFSANISGLTTVIPTTVTIAGTVWDDANSSGTTTWTNIKDGVEVGTGGGGLYVYALDSASGTIVEKSAVSSTGTYTLTVPKNVPIRLVLSAENIAEGVTNGTATGTLNTGWVATTPQIRPNFRPTVNLVNVDWGVEEIPVVNAYTVPRQLNPGGTLTVSLPNAAFTGSDPEDGVYPVGLGGKQVRLWPATNGTLYYNGVAVATPTNFSNFNPALVTVDPQGTTVSTITTTFDYSTFDAGGERAVQKTVTLPFEAAILISGNVWDDANGDATKGATEVFTNAGGLNAVLVSSSNVVLDVEAVNATTGGYTFDQAISATSYSIIITTANPALGSTLSSSTLPGSGAWVHTGVNLGGSTPNTSNKTGIIGVTTGALGSAAITNRNFGIEQIPSGANYTATRQLNPGGTIQVSVPTAAFTGTDPEDLTYTTGLSGRKVTLYPATNGTLYYGTTQITSAFTVASFDPTQVKIDPAGTTPTTVTPTFDYQVFDNANVPSTAKTISMPFEAPILISGNVWDDANGDATKGATEVFTNAGGLNAVLVSSSNVVLDVEAVNATTGAYTFDQAISATSYSIIITTANPALGSTLSSSTLPGSGAWVHTGVNLGGSTPNTSNKTGIISVTTGALGSAAITNRNFGIEQIPSGANYTATRQLNPGGTVQVNVPTAAFTGTDPEDLTYTTGLSGRKVTLYPANNGTLYYGTTQITAAFTVTSFDPTQVKIDPAGTTPTTVTPTFNYQVFDNANVPSTVKTISMPFEAPILISGNVWDDANADAIKASPEVFTNAGGLFAVLTDASGNVLQVSAVNATTGAYTFDQAISATSYRIILSTTAPAINSSLSASSLPAPATGAWINTGVNIATVPNTANRTGIISFTTGALGSANLVNYNFGIEQLPLAGTVTAPGRPNPGDTLSVIVPPATFTGSDNDGVVSSIRITGFPTNTTSIQVGTVRYYPTAATTPTTACPVGTTCATFPVAGITIPASATSPGQPTTVIRIDPVNGTQVVSIPFKTIDNGNQESTTGGIANVPFTDPLPPVAYNIDNDPINSSAGPTHIGGFVASDPQGDPILTYKVLTLPTVASGLLYTCSNNTVPCTGTYTLVTVNQVLTPIQSQTLYFKPDSAFIGNATFTYNATSKNGTSNTATENMPVINNPPTANSFTTDPVKRNSSNNPVPPLSGTDGDGVVVTYTVNPPAPTQGTLTYCVTPPSTGCGTPITTTVTLTPEQVKYISYTPAPDYTGITTFTYTTKDNNNLVSDTATVTIPVTNLGLDPRQLPPVTQNITLAPLNSASPAVRIAELIGSDPDGTIASYKILSLPSTSIGRLYACSNGTFPCTGTLTAVVVNQTLTPAQAQTLQFDPAANNNTTPARFRYSATDNDNLVSNISTYTIPVLNQPPTAFAIQERVPFNAVNYPIPALQGTDDDGTINTYRITAIPNVTTQGTLYTCSSNSIPCTGTYTPVAANANLTPAQIASLTFTPVTGFTGTATGTYLVIDNNSKQSNTAPITLRVDNQYTTGLPPFAVGNTYSMGANDGTALLQTNFISATDPDGSISSYTITSLPPVSQGRYTYCTTPPSTSCNNPLTVGLVLTPAQAAALRFTPDPTYSGPSYLGFYATDNDNNLSNLAVSVVNVASKPPIATGYTTAAVKSGGASILTPLLASDYLDNGTVVGYTVTKIPSVADGSLSYCTTPPSTGCNTPVVVGTKLTPAQAATVRFTPGANITVHEVVFNFTATDNSTNRSNVASIVVPVLDPTLCIKVRAYLEGALMDNGSGIATAPDGRPLMRDNLRNSPFTNENYIPSLDPYEFATDYVDVTQQYTKFVPQTSAYPVLQRVMDSAVVFGVAGQNAIVDWAFVELRNKRNSAQVLATRAGLIQRDGDIVDVDGTGCLAFPDVAIDSYYVSVRHRSHLGTMTKYGQSAAVLNTLVDFTVPATPLFERTDVPNFNYTGLAQNTNLIGTYRALWQGDFNADGKIKYDNPNDDVANMLFDVLSYPTNEDLATNYDFAYGYRQGDFDMNSKTKFDNPNDDNAVLLFQALSYPLNVDLATNFDFFLQQLP